ncbi:uncharacterized protein EI90DRAFT_2911455 [Cantharellus anzutake]|uniref:uncharacterized protein n=1 Tax=Cantharellus anzutake TaxID=1750568 RepID=UPI001902C445|nr:uncharacterized protein EI90DRAFT_2911455 [Cantharellus anzutake]KAF8336440.1 hypothetical protein EI90DRAFT_2911455 [Cantharellus anzutake]
MDAFGIEYHLETPQQFWLEISDILNVPRDATLAELDAILRIFISFCATYHERYLSTLAQLEHSCQLLLDSDFFTFHSGRSCDLLLEDAHKSTDPHQLFILYNVFLCWGSRHPPFFRAEKRWRPLLGHLMDHLTIEIGDASANFIEGKLALLACEMLYEICRVQKWSFAELKVFKDSFIEHLFEVIESTRSSETLNYSLIKLIVALNEQFMVASLGKGIRSADDVQQENRIISILMKRLNESKTFSENLIFMLNRIDETEEDRCLELLILKMLYLLFTTPGTQECFYTNDLRVLVEVFIRELNNLSDDQQSLKHTYLRVLNPLLNNTQLRKNPHKPLLVRHTLDNFISHAQIRDIDPTTRRLVGRCLSAEWTKSVAPPTPTVSTPTVDQDATSVDFCSTQTGPPAQIPFTNGSNQAVMTNGPRHLQDRSIPPRMVTRSASVELLSTASLEEASGLVSDLDMQGHTRRRASIRRTPSKRKMALKARPSSTLNFPTLDVERDNDGTASLPPSPLFTTNTRGSIRRRQSPF